MDYLVIGFMIFLFKSLISEWNDSNEPLLPKWQCDFFGSTNPSWPDSLLSVTTIGGWGWASDFFRQNFRSHFDYKNPLLVTKVHFLKNIHSTYLLYLRKNLVEARIFKNFPTKTGQKLGVIEIKKSILDFANRICEV